MKQKTKHILYLLAIAICWVGGVTLIISGGTNVLFHLKGALKVGVILLGVLLLLLSCVLCYMLLSLYIKENRELRIEEEDERNQMIRGIAAQNTNLVFVFLLVAAMIVLSALNYTLAAVILMAIILIGNLVNLLFIGYYDKRL
ncbi:MAG: hypothetical protein J6D02_08680 [Lachnospira sp.]|nr:hypothetical protein [Lachnospira sp.]